MTKNNNNKFVIMLKRNSDKEYPTLTARTIETVEAL